MSIGTNPPLAIVEEGIPNAAARKRGARTIRIRGSRPSMWVYVALGVVFVASAFPFYFSFLIGSGDASTLRDPGFFPAGNFVANALKVMSDPAVNFWAALWNSIYSSVLIAVAVVISSTLAGWAFAKLKFAGGSALLVSAIASVIILAVTMLIVWQTSRALHFTLADRIVALFCGSKKTLASGVPMARLIFGAHPGLGIILLPLMLYHPLQLVVGGWLAGRFARATPEHP